MLNDEVGAKNLSPYEFRYSLFDIRRLKKKYQIQ